MPLTAKLIGVLALLIASSVMGLRASAQADGGRPPSAPIGAARIGEGVLRKTASVQKVPIYPPQSLRAGAFGVAVAEIEIETSGAVARTEILEAPDRWIADAMTAAVSAWRFPPATLKSGRAITLTGKLTFYFVIRDGHGQVFAPATAPFVGRPSAAVSARQSRKAS